MSAPTFGSIGTLFGSTSSTPAIAVPASVASGDIVIVVMFTDVSGTTITAFPTGFAEAANSPQTVNAGGGGNYAIHVAWKRATGADSGTYTFTLSASVFSYAYAVRYTGCVAAGNPWDVTTAADGGATSQTVTPNTSLTTTGPDEMLFHVGESNNGDAGTWSAPSGYNLRSASGSGIVNISVSDLVQTAAGGTGSIHSTSTASGQTGAWFGALIGTTASATAAPVPIVVTTPAPKTTGNQALALRNTLQDPPVLTTPVPLIVTRPEQPRAGNEALLSRGSLFDAATPAPIIVTSQPAWRAGNLAQTLRNTLADPPVLTTPAPIIGETGGRAVPILPALISRSSLADVVVTGVATPPPVVVTPTVRPVPGVALVGRSTLQDPPVLTTPVPLVVSPPVVAGLPPQPLLIRSSLIDLTTPAPMVVMPPQRPPIITAALISRNTLADVTTVATPAPLVVSGTWAAPRISQPLLVRSSLADAAVLAPAATPQPIIVTTAPTPPWPYRPIVLAGAVCICVTHRPSSGITARPNTGVTLDPCC